MGFRTMVSPNRGQAPHFPPLARQGSLYNLTLDEVESQLGNLGKPLNNMNLDELLKSIFAAEENQVAQNEQMSASASIFPGNFNLNQTLGRKTVDDVWREIVVQQEQGNGGGDGSVPRQQTLGETTLEDFLFHIGAINVINQDGVVNPPPLMGADPMVAAPQQADWLQFQMETVQQQQMEVLSSNLPVSVSMFGNSVVDVGYSENNQLALTVPMPMVAATSSDSQAVVERKRPCSDEIMEKTIERRQKRMIKNRESAARSRAKKQAYNDMLESKLSQLKETNKTLKKQKGIGTLNLAFAMAL
ncbi:hypothetical protein HHK36_008041 [Tetracentron sinense]|uniref:BZIP domain-containing protein n=1 Tax=Tetracentron sinense TaxID=13715 RepID=A0A835DJN3_TETSI|nr:hypothetical protein HHK36_008041 [Tetracentron sinense]